jgi:bifunctional non-homologous end joining protein LigD
MSNTKKIIIEGHTIDCSHLDKVFFPKSKITKENVILYYQEMAPHILPLYEDRLLTMQRCPDGIEGEIFIQKAIPSYFPKWIDHHTVSTKGNPLKQVLVNNEATLVYLANQACLTFHLGLSKIDKINYPSYLIFDLDPSLEDIVLLKTVVKRVKQLLDDLEVKAFIQTTGSRGFHIYIPLKKDSTFTKTHAFAKKFASYLAQEYPQEITIEQRKIKREKKVLIDYMRNSLRATSVAPYSLRPKENAPVATPLNWDELEDKDLTSQSYNLKNIFKRLNKIKDPWGEMFHHQSSIKLMQEKLDQLITSK